MKGGKKYAALLRFLLLIGGLFPVVQTVSGQADKNNHHAINIGLKAGLNALSLSHYKAYQGETELSNLSGKNKSGYGLNLFFRINLDRFFMQPEAEWSLYKQEISYDYPVGDNYQSTHLSIETQAAKINVLVGYNMTKSGPFLLNLVIGPSFRDNFKSRYGNTLWGNPVFQNTRPNYSTNGIMGITINIAKVHFDIRYEISFFNSNISFDEMSGRPDLLEGISIRKRENILSFSCGWMF
ncbi:MAG: PorT family protein [Candidatus Azobacteroides sp.]|nr:PorT family protein [Candidatus Azobacteroides sp.]